MSLAVSPSLTQLVRSDTGTDPAARALQALVQMAGSADAPLEALVKAVAANNLTTLAVNGETLQVRLSLALPVGTALTITPATNGSAAVSVQVKPQAAVAQMAPESGAQAASAAVVSAMAATSAASAPLRQTETRPIAGTVPVATATLAEPDAPGPTVVPAVQTPRRDTANGAGAPVPVAAPPSPPKGPERQMAEVPRAVATGPEPAPAPASGLPRPPAAASPTPVPTPSARAQRSEGGTPQPLQPMVAAAPQQAVPPAPSARPPPVMPSPAGMPGTPSAPVLVASPAAPPVSAPAILAPKLQAMSQPPTPAAPPVVSPAGAARPTPGSPASVSMSSAPSTQVAVPDGPEVPPMAEPARPSSIPYPIAPRPSSAAPSQAAPDLARAMATQQPLAPMLADAVKLAADSAMPQPLRAAAQQVVAQALDPARAPLDATKLRQAVEGAGVLRPLLPLATPDLGTRLTALRDVLTRLLGNDAPVLSADRRRPAPLPLRGDAPHAERSELVSVADEPANGLARRLLGETEGALSRLKLLQAASQPADGRVPDAARAAEYRVEVPMLLGREATTVQFVFDREAQPHEQKKPRGWRMRFALNVAALGEVGADISIMGAATQVTVWASETETASLIESMLPDLGPALAARGLEPGTIRLRHGRPGNPAPGRMLDSAT